MEKEYRRESQDLSPPRQINDFERIARMPTLEEERIVEHSTKLARRLLESHRKPGGNVEFNDYSYNDYIAEMNDRGIGREFANIALDRVGVVVGRDAVLSTR